MKRAITAVLCAVLLPFGQLISAQADQAPKYSQKTLLKNWALSRCLAKVSADNATKEDANATASAYLEEGKVPVEAYAQLTSLVDSYAKRTYGGSIKSDFNTMKCIDLYQSSELERLAAKLAGKK